MRRLVPLLVAGLLALTGVAAPSPVAPTAAAASGPKIVLIVGATHAATDSYRADMDAVYATAIQYSSNVVKVYSPNATWAAAKAALQGANIVVYMGHGNGFPSPYHDDSHARPAGRPRAQRRRRARAIRTRPTTASPTSPGAPSSSPRTRS